MTHATHLPNLSREEPHVDADGTAHYFNSSLWQLDPFIMYAHAAAAVLEELGWAIASRAERDDPDARAVLSMVVLARHRRHGRWDWPDGWLTDLIDADPWHRELMSRWLLAHAGDLRRGEAP